MPRFCSCIRCSAWSRTSATVCPDAGSHFATPPESETGQGRSLCEDAEPAAVVQAGEVVSETQVVQLLAGPGELRAEVGALHRVPDGASQHLSVDPGPHQPVVGPFLEGQLGELVVTGANQHHDG